jgi:DNA polymerase III subunit gamma/tau
MTDLSAKYRPTRFDEVRGQALAVQWCRNQIRWNKGQSVLFSGPIGAGKTSLALIYAKARFCGSPTEDMSPCGSCASCIEFGERGQNLPDFTRLDCGERGRIEDVTNLADLARQGPFNTDYRVFFLDEVHNLSPRGFDALLKALETHHKWGPTIILATTKLDKVPRTIRSRVKELELQLFSQAECTTYLRDICTREEFTFETEALDVLSSASAGHPVLRLDFTNTLLDYAIALLNGDLQAQLNIVEDWHEEPARKLEFVHRLLTFIFLNDVLRIVRADPLIDPSAPAQRAEIVDGFAQRAKKLGLSINAFWQCALESLLTEGRVSASVLLTRLTAFHFLVNGEAPSNVRSAAAAISVNSQKPQGRGFTRLRAVAARPAQANCLTRQQVAQIYHVGSFLPQHYGTLFNVRISIHHGKLSVQRHDDAVGLASALTHEIRLKLEYRLPPNVNGFHWSHVHERDQEGGLVTRMAAYISPNHIEEILTWVRHRFFAKRFPQAPANALRVARTHCESLDARLQFHWSSVRAQMRGLEPTVLERTASSGLTPLIELLGIPSRLRTATGGAECRKVFGTSKSLGPTARRDAANDQMKFLSAFNDRAWSSLYIGWEIPEFADRNLERKHRLDEADKMRAMFSGGTELANARRTDELRKLRASFPTNPRLRRRTWSGWWLHSTAFLP